MTFLPAGVTVDVVRAESARFRRPLLMIHGLWTGGWIWLGLAGYLAHRGWESWIPSFDAENAPTRLHHLEEICRGLSAPPVLVAHDAGVLLAARLATVLDPPTMIAISPLLPRALGGDLGIFSHPQLWAGRALARSVRPPHGTVGNEFFAGLGADVDRLRADSGAFFRAVFRARTAYADLSLKPGMLVASPEDPTLSPLAAERFASRLGWSFELHESPGHFPIVTPGWERLADRVHRWLVQTLGEELLVFLDEDEELE